MFNHRLWVPAALQAAKQRGKEGRLQILEEQPWTDAEDVGCVGRVGRIMDVALGKTGATKVGVVGRMG